MPVSKPDNEVKLNIPPHSIEAEQSVLGSLMISSDAWDKVADVLIESDFYNRSHRMIYASIIRLINANQSVDTVTVKDELSLHNELEDAGGFPYLIELAKNTPSASNVAAYAHSIREKAIVRELIGVAHDIAEVGFNPEGRDSKEVLDLAETKVFEIAEKRTAAGEGPVDVKSVLKKTVARLDELVKQDAEVTGVSTGFDDLDKKTSGLQRSDLIIVAARPSMGKCIAADSLLVNPATGKLESIEHRVKHKSGNVLSVNNAFSFERAEASDFVDDGHKPTFKVTTRLGRHIETTLTHPFLTGKGWQALEKLNVGDKIAVPRRLNVFGKESLPEHIVEALALLSGAERKKVSRIDATQACKNKLSATSFVTSLEKILQSGLKQLADLTMLQAHLLEPASVGNADSFCHLTQRNIAGHAASSSDVEINASCVNDSAISSLKYVLNDYFQNELPDAFDYLPEAVFTLPKHQLSRFLNIHLSLRGSFEGCDRFSYQCENKQLAFQLQHLLLRFGVLAKVSCDKESRFMLQIEHHQSLRILLSDIGLRGMQDQQAQVVATLNTTKGMDNSDCLPQSVIEYIIDKKAGLSWQALAEQHSSSIDVDALALMDFETSDSDSYINKESGVLLNQTQLSAIAALLDDKYLKDLASADVYWDEIVDIQYMGYKQVYDLSVPKLHNFIAQDICVHNTTFAMNLCENAMMMQEKPVLVFSLEMPAEQIMMRMLASLSRVDQTKIRTAKLGDTDWVKLQQTMQNLHKKDNLYIDDSSGLTPMDLRTRARKLAREKGGISMIMIDYLQLMRVPSLSDNRTLEIAEISRSLKALAKELQVPVIALSQLNRGLEQRSDKRPINSDLRESGSIEQDADLIMFIYRDEVYHENSEYKGIAEIIIGKQRNGPIGTSRLTFQGQFSRFDNYAGPEFSDDY